MVAAGRQVGMERAPHGDAHRGDDGSAILDATGGDGAFVAELVTAEGTFSENPRYDLDMNAFALVMTYRQGEGRTHPDINWEPKQAFHAVADVCAHHTDQAPPKAPEPASHQMGLPSPRGQMNGPFSSRAFPPRGGHAHGARTRTHRGPQG